MTFNADSFMQSTVDGPGSTELPKTPEGEFRVMIGDVNTDNLKTIPVTNRETGGKEDRMVLDVPFIIEGQEVNSRTNRSTIVHHETFWLDFDANGKLDMGEGKNVKLNQLRAAVDQNVGGWTPRHLAGAGPLMISVKHAPGKGSNEGKTFVNVNKFAKITT